MRKSEKMKRMSGLLLAGILGCWLLAGCEQKEAEDTQEAQSSESAAEEDRDYGEKQDAEDGQKGATGEDSAGHTQTEERIYSYRAEELTAAAGAMIQCYAAEPDFGQARNFAKELFVRSLPEENPVLSPVSAYIALSLTGEGAKGETAEEFRKVLGEAGVQISQDFMERLPADKDQVKVMLANSAWVDDGLEADQTWLSVAKGCFRSQVYQADLATLQTKDDINNWIESNTQGLIRDFLAEPFDESARMALFNTVYFKGKWVKAFEASATYERPFTLGDGKEISVPTMNMTADLDYFRTDRYEGIVLPYRDTELEFVALKALDDTGVDELFDALDMEELGAVLAQATKEKRPERKVALHLPKFEVSYDRKLNEDLQDMGLQLAFTDQADFSGLGTTERNDPLYIDLVRQKVVFILDEEGTEAAAVTEVAVLECAAAFDPVIPLEVDFNRPFVYMVYDRHSQTPIFLGIMDNPANASR